eukprot:gene4618-6302_t
MAADAIGAGLIALFSLVGLLPMFLHGSLIGALLFVLGGFVLLDADDRVLAWNHSFVAMFPWVRPLLAPQVPFRELVAETAKHVVHEGGPGGWLDLNMSQLAREHSEQEA